MANITLYKAHPQATTSVSNHFIDEQMTHANGDYVKIYLYLLRRMSRSDCAFSLSQIADHFELTERDVMRALNYWEKLHLFSLEYDDAQNLSGIHFLNEREAEEHSALQQAPTHAADRFIQATAPAASPSGRKDIHAFCNDAAVQELVFITEQYLGRTLNTSDLNTIFFWYDELNLSTELIEFLIENCVATGHTSLHYMQKIAEDYAANSIHTVEEAKEYTNQRSAVYCAVAKAFGIRGRNLVPEETNYLKQWTTRFGFSVELIEEACSRTMRTIHNPSFGYANTILKTWHDQGVSSLEDVARVDANFQKNAELSRSQKAAAGANASANRFVNFTQRNNNYDEIQKQLIQNSMQ